MLALALDCSTEYAQRTFIACVQMLAAAAESPRAPRHGIIGAVTALIAAATAVAALTTGRTKP